jgi:hypothetical protein
VKPQILLVDAVRNWVHFDNLAESLNKQVTNARNLRAQHETNVLKLLETTGMQNATIQITGATLQRSQKSKPTDLSWGYLEEQLHNYYKTKGKPDETSTIISFLHDHRGIKNQEYLKKTVTADKLK